MELEKRLETLRVNIQYKSCAHRGLHTQDKLGWGAGSSTLRSTIFPLCEALQAFVLLRRWSGSQVFYGLGSVCDSGSEHELFAVASRRCTRRICADSG